MKKRVMSLVKVLFYLVVCYLISPFTLFGIFISPVVLWFNPKEISEIFLTSVYCYLYFILPILTIVTISNWKDINEQMLKHYCTNCLYYRIGEWGDVSCEKFLTIGTKQCNKHKMNWQHLLIIKSILNFKYSLLTLVGKR